MSNLTLSGQKAARLFGMPEPLAGVLPFVHGGYPCLGKNNSASIICVKGPVILENDGRIPEEKDRLMNRNEKTYISTGARGN